MEALFNLAWIATALLAVGLWCIWPAEATHRRDRTRQCIALIVLLAVLFPVISLTDDFQSATVWAEAEAGARRLLAQHMPLSADAALQPVSTTQPSLASLPFTGEILSLVGRQPLPANRFWPHAAAIRPPPAA